VRLRSIMWVATCSSAPSFESMSRTSCVTERPDSNWRSRMVGADQCGCRAQLLCVSGFVVNDRVVMHLQARVEAVERAHPQRVRLKALGGRAVRRRQVRNWVN
jgi:hypothetical protein